MRTMMVGEAVCDVEAWAVVDPRIDAYHVLLEDLVSGRKLSYEFIHEVLRSSSRTLQELQQDFYAH